MLAYVVVFSIVIFLAWVSTLAPSSQYAKSGKPDSFFFSLSGLVAAIFLGTREGVGADFDTIYVQGFAEYSMGQESRFESGFNALQSLVLLYTNDYHFLFIICSLITVALIYIAIYRWSPDPVFSVVIFLLGGLFFVSTNAVRQALAIGIFLNAIPYIVRGNPLKYAALILAAALFHKSALILLPLYLLRKIKLPYIAPILLGILCFLMGDVLVQVALRIGSLLSSQFAVYARLDHYLVGDLDLTDGAYLLLSLAFLAYVNRKSPSIYMRNNTIRIYTNIVICGVLIVVLTGSMFILFRLARYFTPVLILFLPSLANSLKRESDRAASKRALCLFLALGAYVVYGVLEIESAVPYISCMF